MCTIEGVAAHVDHFRMGLVSLCKIGTLFSSGTIFGSLG